MAFKHQESQFLTEFSYTDQIKISKKSYTVFDNNICEIYKGILNQSFRENDLLNMILVNSVQVNSVKFRSGYLISHNSHFSEIDHVIMFKNQFWFLCKYDYSIEEYDTFLNSFLLRKNEKTRLISLTDVKNVQVYEKRNLRSDTFLIVEDLELYHMLF